MRWSRRKPLHNKHHLLREKGLREVTSAMAKTNVKAQHSKLVARARTLRQRQTDAEKILWYHLRNRRLGGHKFRRQHPIGRYIVDYFCDAAHLVVELDGGGHNEPRQIAYDQVRTSWFEKQGLQVLRFWNDDVLTDTDKVLEAILGAIQNFTSPCPSPRRRGDADRT